MRLLAVLAMLPVFVAGCGICTRSEPAPAPAVYSAPPPPLPPPPPTQRRGG